MNFINNNTKYLLQITILFISSSAFSGIDDFKFPNIKDNDSCILSMNPELTKIYFNCDSSSRHEVGNKITYSRNTLYAYGAGHLTRSGFSAKVVLPNGILFQKN